MRRLVIAVLFFVIVGIGVGVFLLLSSKRAEPRRQEKGEQPTVVAAMEAPATEKPVTVTAMGTVVPARQVTVYPEVAGRIVYQDPELVPGGRLAAGQVILRIDPRDYDLEIKQQQAAVSQAELQLAKEHSLKAVAEKEWSLIRDEVEPTEQGRRLALREIQLENAKVALDSARSVLAKARLRRSRATIRAPFNAVVLDEFTDVGQVVGNSSRIAVLADADRYWVRAAVPVDRLVWIQIPGVNADVGSTVRVVQRAGPELTIERPGRVIRLLSDLDPRGKMARVLVEVDSPQASGASVSHAHAVGSTPPAKGAISPMHEAPAPTSVPTQEVQARPVIPLFIGSWVTVHIQGPRLAKVLALPRMALRDRNKVWVMNGRDKLEIRDVKVVWSRDDTVFVSGDLRPGEWVITSRISAPVQGMLVKTDGREPAPGGERAP